MGLNHCRKLASDALFVSTLSGSAHLASLPGFRGKSAAPPGAIHVSPLRGPHHPRKEVFARTEENRSTKRLFAFSLSHVGEGATRGL